MCVSHVLKFGIVDSIYLHRPSSLVLQIFRGGSYIGQ